MSSDSEEIEGKKVLLIVGGTYNVDAAARFLIRRKIESKIVNKVTDAVTEIVRFKPDYVFYSVSHPNKKVRNLPNFLVQHFNVRCIAFAEESSAKIMHQLTITKNAYKMSNSPTGPNFLRYIQHMIKEGKAKPKSEKSALSGQGNKAGNSDSGSDKDRTANESKGNQSDSMVHIKSSGSAANTADSNRKLSVDKSSNKNNFMMFKNDTQNKGDKPPSRLLEEVALQNEQFEIASAIKKETASSQSIEVAQPEIGVESKAGFFNENLEDGDRQKREQSLIDMLSRSLSSTEDDSEHKDKNTNIEKPDESGADQSLIFDEAKRDAAVAKDFSASILSESNSIDLTKPLKELELDLGGGPRQSIFHSIYQDAEHKDLRGKCTEVFSDTSESNLDPHRLTDQIKSFFVFPMEYSSNIGYAILASDIAIDKNPEQKLITFFKSQIIPGLGKEKTHFALGKSVPIVLEEIFVFENLISNKVSPITTFRFQEQKWSLLFMPHDAPRPIPKGEKSQSKIAIETNDIPSDTPTLMDIYIFLTKNEKFFLYLRKGRLFSEKQKNKILHQNRTIYIDEHDLDLFISFYVQNQILHFFQNSGHQAA